MFNSEEFKEAWTIWKKHKQEKHGSPYTPTSEQKALSVLFKKSHGIEALAIQSIEDSIEHNWASIYITNNNSKSNGNKAGINRRNIEETIYGSNTSQGDYAKGL